MENSKKKQGVTLRERAKVLGFDMKSLANQLNISRAVVEKDFASEIISRKSLVKYIPLLFTTVDEFYKISNKDEKNSMDSAIDVNSYAYLKDELLAAKDEVIDVQRKLIESLNTQLRFFPSAAQQVVPA